MFQMVCDCYYLEEETRITLPTWWITLALRDHEFSLKTDMIKNTT